MGIFVAIAILFILISCVLFLVRTPLAQWGSWQWIFLAFSVLLLLFFVAMVWYSIQTHRERKEEKAERAQQEREARRRQAAITTWTSSPRRSGRNPTTLTTRATARSRRARSSTSTAR